MTCENTKLKPHGLWIFCFLQNMNLKIVYLIFHDASFLLFDLRELCALQLAQFWENYETGTEYLPPPPAYEPPEQQQTPEQIFQQ